MAATQNPQSAPLNGNRWTDEEVASRLREQVS